MKIYIKGGPWTNLEDEVLKAAVMKYGKNQWDRIASLLNRKSAKQCKARWNEWLEPRIKKTPWTKEEEEKLLHLVKIYPTQWRTIAPRVGRTAYQCIEHFEYLLDKYQERDEDYDPSEDPRKLRPGEVDYNAEHKPALPDSIDMDEDEKEMLSEAKARMANTMGKKAKRKARERQLEEQRRLAHLKKKRELKAAGIYVIENKRQKKKKLKNKYKKVNLLKEIPFRKEAPKGFHDTSMEKAKSQPLAPERSLVHIEGRLKEMEETKNRQKDQEKLKQRKASALPDVIQQLDRIHDTKGHSKHEKRSTIILPQPQISDNDIQTLSKIGGGSSSSSSSSSTNYVTNNLLSSYANTPAIGGGGGGGKITTPFPSFMRTPQVNDSLKEQTRQLQALRTIQTPFMKDSQETPSSNFDFLKKKGKKKKIRESSTIQQTPNPFKQQQEQQRRNTSSVRSTPLRDELGLNKGRNEIQQAKETKHSKRLRAQLKRENMRKKFQSFVPEPQKEEYQLRSMIHPSNHQNLKKMKMEEAQQQQQLLFNNKKTMMKDDDEQQQQHSEEEYESLFSLPIQKNLPIPKQQQNHSFLMIDEDDDDDDEIDYEKIQELMQKEMNSILSFDISFKQQQDEEDEEKDDEEEEHSTTTKKRRRRRRNRRKKKNANEKRRRGGYLLDFKKSEIESARNLIEKEMKNKNNKIQVPSQEQFDWIWEKNMLNFERNEKDTSTLFEEYSNLKTQTIQNEEQVEKMKEKVDILTKGYVKIEKEMKNEIDSIFEEISQKEIQKQSFSDLLEMEEMAIPKRIKELEEKIQQRKEKEDTMQHVFEELNKNFDQLREG